MVSDFWSRCPDLKAKQNCYIKPTKRESGKEYFYKNSKYRKSTIKKGK